MKKFKCVILTVFVVLMLTSCAKPNLELTSQQINNIDYISINKPKLSKDLDLMIKGITRNNLGITGNADLMIIGALIDFGNQKSFEMNNTNKLSKIREYKVENVDKRIELIMLSVLKKDTFLNKKVINDATTYFDSEIINFGLEKRDLKESKEVKLCAKITLKAFLIGENGNHLIDETTLITQSRDAYSVDELSNDNKLIGKLFEQAYDNFEILFKVHLNRTFKNKEL